MSYNILSINPGSTSTKIALYEDETPVFTENIVHTAEDLAPFPEITDQLEYRLKMVLSLLEIHAITPQGLAAVVGRGGMLTKIHAGGYRVNREMCDYLSSGAVSPHASNLGALIAFAIAEPSGIPAYIYDCVGSDEFEEIAKVTGIPGMIREPQCHVLNTKAMGRKTAELHGTQYDKINLIIAHLGGGFSVSAHKKGRIIDNVRDDSGSFSPERSGSVPMLYLIDMCYSGKFTKKEMIGKIRGLGGLQALLGTKDLLEVERRIAQGDAYAKLVYEAMAYQISKSVGEMSTVLKGDVDYVVLTGGVAHSKMLTSLVAERVSFIAPVEILPGENEMEALTLGTLRILRGEEKADVFHILA